MSYEVELKFPLPDPAPVLAAVRELGGVAGEPSQQADLYFNHPSRNFAQTHEAFRIRSSGDENCITYKGPVVDTQAKVREEIELAFAPGPAARDELRTLLTLLGFRPVLEVRKTRTPYHLTWQGREVEVAFDEVAGLGTYVELETLAEEAEREPARDAILALAARLHLTQVERRSYLSLSLQRLAGSGGLPA